MALRSVGDLARSGYGIFLCRTRISEMSTSWDVVAEEDGIKLTPSQS
jgi:hypothetical protein